MNQPEKKDQDEADTENTKELIVFAVESLTCALDIAHAQEIKGQLKIIEVPEAPLHVRGVANLRGQVITVIDLRIVFGIEPKEVDKESRILFVRHDGSVIGLLADYVDDIVSARVEDLELAPANISGVQGEFFDHVYKRDGDLACVLNIDRILKQG